MKNKRFSKTFNIQNFGSLPIISSKWKCIEHDVIKDFNSVQSDFYQTNKFFPNGFYKPISLLINFNFTNDNEE